MADKGTIITAMLLTAVPVVGSREGSGVDAARTLDDVEGSAVDAALALDEGEVDIAPLDVPAPPPTLMPPARGGGGLSLARVKRPAAADDVATASLRAGT